MRSERTAKLRRKFEGEIHSVFASAIRNQETWGRINSRLTFYVYRHDEFKRLPMWAKTALYSHRDGCCSMLERFYLEWRVKYNGEYIVGKEVPEGEWAKVEQGSHFYIGTNVEYWPEGEWSDDYEYERPERDDTCSACGSLVGAQRRDSPSIRQRSLPDHVRGLGGVGL